MGVNDIHEHIIQKSTHSKLNDPRKSQANFRLFSFLLFYSALFSFFFFLLSNHLGKLGMFCLSLLVEPTVRDTNQVYLEKMEMLCHWSSYSHAPFPFLLASFCRCCYWLSVEKNGGVVGTNDGGRKNKGKKMKDDVKNRIATS